MQTHRLVGALSLSDQIVAEEPDPQADELGSGKRWPLGVSLGVILVLSGLLWWGLIALGGAALRLLG